MTRLGWVTLAAIVLLAILVTGWVMGGEQPLRPVEQPVTVPAGAQPANGAEDRAQ